MEYLPFQNFIDAAPKQFFSCNEKCEIAEEYKFTNSIEAILSSLDSEKELTLLEYKLNELDKDKQFDYVEIFLSKLINSSYTIRKEIGNIEENKNLKIKLINEIEGCIVCILSLLKRKNINIPTSFAEKYKNSNHIGILIKKMLDSQNKNTQQSKLDEPFTTQITQKQRDSLFNKLKNNKFICNDTDENSFMYVFGVNKSPQKFKPIKWLEKVGLLAYFINQYTEDNNIWKKTECFFVLINGNKPNINSMKNTISKIKNDSKNKPKNSHLIDEILKE